MPSSTKTSEDEQAGWSARRFPHGVGSMILEPLEALGLLTQVPTEGAKPLSLVRDWDLETRWAATPFSRRFTPSHDTSATLP